MKLTNFIVAMTVVIAATLNFDAQGSPRPQLDINLGPTKVLSLDPLGILFGRPTKPTPTAAPIFTRPTPIVTPSPPTQPIVVNPTPAPTVAQPDITLCVRRCAGTPEYNPVCGSDGIVYNNPEMLTCVINCGINVAQLHTGRCFAPTPRPESSTIVPMPTTVTPKAPTPAPEAIPLEAFVCAQNCMLTQEYNPVCGTDGVTYRNAELLICTQNCGINVTQRSSGRCDDEESFSIDPRDGSV